MISVQLCPKLKVLEYSNHTRIFQNKNVPEIIKLILEKNQLFNDSYKFLLNDQYSSREYCVQYCESDLDFIKRLCCEEGIYYFFKQEKNKEIIIFGDNTSAYIDSVPEKEVLYHPITGTLKKNDEFLYQVTQSSKVYTGMHMLNAYDYNLPNKSLLSRSLSYKFSNNEYYKHIGGYKESAEGENLAKKNRESCESQEIILSGKGNFRCISPGHKININSDSKRQFPSCVVKSAIHKAFIKTESSDNKKSDGLIYNVSFDSTLVEKIIRPVHVIPKPRISVQTAVVVGPGNEEIYTDKLGRVKVQFHWDLEGTNNENSSCWVRVNQQWAGSGFGFYFIPRIGHEVIVDFIQGDPDLPIIIGSVYNGTNTPPYTDTNKTISALKTNSTPGGNGKNAIILEDKKNQELFLILAQKDMKTNVNNNKITNVGSLYDISCGNMKVNVKENVDFEAGGNVNTIINKNNKTVIEEMNDLTINKENTINMKDNELIIDGDNTIEITGENEVKITEKHKLTAKKIEYEVEEEMIIKCGSSYISIKEDIIEIFAEDMNIKGDQVSIKGDKISSKASDVHRIKGSLVKIC